MICLIMYVMIAYHTQTDIKVNTEDTLSRFQELLIQLIIKHRSNKRKTIEKKMSDGTRTINLHHGTPWEKDTVTTRPFLHLEI